MALEKPLFDIGFCQAAADYRTKQFHIMDISGNFAFTIAGTSGQAAVGILQDKPDAGQVGNIMAIGVSKVMIGTGGLTAGGLFMADTDGTAVAATGTGKYALGMVIKGGSAGELATVIIGTAGAGQLN